jgi:hypothetical protein
MASTCPQCGTALPDYASSAADCPRCGDPRNAISARREAPYRDEGITEEARRYRLGMPGAEHRVGSFDPAISKPLGARQTGYVLVALTTICILLCLASLAAETQRIAAVERVIARGVPIGPAEADEIDRLPQILSITYLLASVVSGIVMLVWFYRAYRNLEVLGCIGRSMTPGWAVGYFFIPIANLFRPYQAAQEIWKGSDPACLDDYEWTHQPGSALILFWWLVRIGGFVVDRIGASMLQSTQLEGLIAGLKVLMAAYALGAVVDVLLIAMVLRINRRQDRKYDRLFGAESSDDPYAVRA